MASTLDIRLLGNFRLIYDDRPLTTVNTPRLQALLAYLVLHRQAPQSRQHLAFVLWSDTTDSQAHTNLRNLLHRLRRALPNAEHFLHIDGQTVQWQPEGPFTLDVADFERAAAGAGSAAGLEEAVNLYPGDLLPGCYDEWLLPKREQLRQAFTETLERLVLVLEAQRDYQKAIHYGQRLLQHDPLHEATYRRLMRIYALNGDRAAALQTYHSCVTLLQQELAVEPGAATREVYERLLKQASLAVTATPPSAPLAAQLPLVGREQEWECLRQSWRLSMESQAHFVLISGEAGIGKTRLAEELGEWAKRQGLPMASARCYAAGRGLAYAPVVAWLQTGTLRTALASLADVWLVEIARLLPELRVQLQDLPHPGPLTESWQRQRLFEALARATVACTQSHPLLLQLDDLQWGDLETFEWLPYLLRFDPQAPLLVVGTVRSEEVGAGHPIEPLLVSLRHDRQLTEIELGPLDAVKTVALAASIARRELDPGLGAQLYQETEGNPLFVVETVRSGILEQPNHAFKSSPLSALSPTIQAVITARLAQLSTPARQLAGLAATMGRAFTFDVLAQASPEDEDSLIQGLEELWQRRIVREQGTEAYDFSHDKIREVAYGELSAARRRWLHRRVAQALERCYGANLDAVSDQVAAHYERAGLAAEAIPYYQRAAEVAQRLFANKEVVEHLRRGLALLKTLPETPERTERDLAILSPLAVALMNLRGYGDPEVGQAYTRAHELCNQMGETPQVAVTLNGLWAFYFVRAEYQPSRELSEQILRIAPRAEDPTALLLVGHNALNANFSMLGESSQAIKHAEQLIGIYDPEKHRPLILSLGQDLKVTTMSWFSFNLWLRGYPDQASKMSQAALRLGRDLAHPYTLGFALGFAGMLNHLCRDVPATREVAEGLQTLSTEYGFMWWTAWAAVFQGWTAAMQGQAADGIAQMGQGLAIFRATGTSCAYSYFRIMLVEVQQKAGQLEEALATLDEALAHVETTGERFYEAEIHRLKGELLLAQGAAEANVADHYQQAIAVARRLSAKSLELRAVMSLSRLWQKQGRRAEACEMLSEMYGWFTEGFDTADLQEAKTLLDELLDN